MSNPYTTAHTMPSHHSAFYEPMTPSQSSFSFQHTAIPPPEALISSISQTKPASLYGAADLPPFCFTTDYKWSPNNNNSNPKVEMAAGGPHHDRRDTVSPFATTFKLPWTPKREGQNTSINMPHYIRSTMPPPQPTQPAMTKAQLASRTGPPAYIYRPLSSSPAARQLNECDLPPQFRSLYNACTVGPHVTTSATESALDQPMGCDLLLKQILQRRTLIRSIATWLCERDALSLALSCAYIYSILDSQWWVSAYPRVTNETGKVSAWAYLWPNSSGYCHFCDRWLNLVMHEPSKAHLCFDCIQMPTFRLVRFAVARGDFALDTAAAFAHLSGLPSVHNQDACFFWTSHLEWVQALCVPDPQGAFEGALSSEVKGRTNKGGNVKSHDAAETIISSPIQNRPPGIPTVASRTANEESTVTVKATAVLSRKRSTTRSRSLTREGGAKKVRWAQKMVMQSAQIASDQGYEAFTAQQRSLTEEDAGLTHDSVVDLKSQLTDSGPAHPAIKGENERNSSELLVQLETDDWVTASGKKTVSTASTGTDTGASTDDDGEHELEEEGSSVLSD